MHDSIYELSLFQNQFQFIFRIHFKARMILDRRVLTLYHHLLNLYLTFSQKDLSWVVSFKRP